ncbi:unnamed protein product [Porites lobata]|uniref:Uncharacterized protein n=1 Tax=Porites lobata TaxID=104759 RepID=A0ABN8PFG7_9CNID|nr:unnamed protein product [Porites lobata]
MPAIKTGMTNDAGHFCSHIGTVSQAVPAAMSQIWVRPPDCSWTDGNLCFGYSKRVSDTERLPGNRGHPLNSRRKKSQGRNQLLTSDKLRIYDHANGVNGFAIFIQIMFRYFDFSKVPRGKNTAHKAMWAHYSQQRESALLCT